MPRPPVLAARLRGRALLGATVSRGLVMRAIELFAGGGGAAMGLHRAGFHTLARCEWDKDACATLRAAAVAGFLDAADVIEGDVRAVDWSPYVGKVDVLWASPPCQAWSSAGKRLGASDDRNGWPWTWDVADAVRPTWLLAENVTGLLMHRGDCDGKGEPESCPACYFHRRILPEAGRRFASVQWAVLNSSAYGVPQHRRRVYLVCGPRPIAWPVETHGDPAEIRQGGMFAPALLPWRTVREALNLSQPFLHREDAYAGRVDADVGAPAPTVRGQRPGGGVGLSDRNGPATQPDILDEPQDTLTGGSTKAHTNGRSILSASKERREVYATAGIRRLTVTECALLMSWPADYPLQGTKTSQYRIVGNGCTPPVVELLARAVIAADRQSP